MHTSRPLLPDFRQSGGFAVFRAKLAADLPAGGSADCHPVIWDGTNWTAVTSITLKIFDPFNRLTGSSGDELWAIWTPEMVGASGDLNRCEAIAGAGGSGGAVWGTLAANISGDPTSCTILKHINMANPGSPANVYQPSSGFFTGNSGARFKASLDASSGHLIFDWVDECH